jgi:hypothetical protein
MQNHILEVICGRYDEYAEYVVNWLAKTFQQPHKQGEVALVLRGLKGSGEGLLGHWIGRAWGAHGIHISNAKHVVGPTAGAISEPTTALPAASPACSRLRSSKTEAEGNRHAKNFAGDSVELDAIPIDKLHWAMLKVIYAHVDTRPLEILREAEKSERELVLALGNAP